MDTEYDILMIEINKCLTDLVSKTETANSVIKPLNVNPLEVKPLNVNPLEVPHKKVRYTDPPEVKWQQVKIVGMPGHFIRRLPVIKMTMCGGCDTGLYTQNHQDCINLTFNRNRVAWKNAQYLMKQ